MTPFGYLMWAAIVAAAVWADHGLQRHRIEPLRQDIEVLRVAVFNHVRHGGDPCEDHIREVLGYGDRE